MKREVSCPREKKLIFFTRLSTLNFTISNIHVISLCNVSKSSNTFSTSLIDKRKYVVTYRLTTSIRGALVTSVSSTVTLQGS